MARIWRTTQKDDTTTQKANDELIPTTQKEEGTTQKGKTTKEVFVWPQGQCSRMDKCLGLR